MKSFEYVAIGADGQTVRGSLFASGEDELDASLEARGLVLTRARELDAKRRVGAARLTRAQLLHMTHQLAFLVHAGVPLVQGLRSVAERMPKGPPQNLVEDMARFIEGGGTLSEAMEQHPAAFPRLMRASVRAGEASGSLDAVLVRIAAHMGWAGRVRATTMQALVYPAILCAAILGLIAILLWFLLPRILTLLPSGEGALPLPTRIVKGISDWGVVHAVPLGFGLVLLVGAFVLARRDPRGRLVLDTIVLRMPGFGSIAAKLSTTKFAATTSVLYRAGCDAFRTLDIASATTDNAALETTFARAADRVRGGALLSEALEKERDIDPLLVQMISVGESTGDLSGALDALVEFYDDEVPRAVKRFLSMLEPAILLGAGAVVAFVLLAAILPIFEVYGSL